MWFCGYGNQHRYCFDDIQHNGGNLKYVLNDKTVHWLQCLERDQWQQMLGREVASPTWDIQIDCCVMDGPDQWGWFLTFNIRGILMKTWKCHGNECWYKLRMRQFEHLLVIWRESIWVWLMWVMQTLKVKVRVLRGAQKGILKSTATPEWFGDGRVSGNQPGYVCEITRGRSYTETAHSSLKPLAKINEKWKCRRFLVSHGPDDEEEDQCLPAWPNFWLCGEYTNSHEGPLKRRYRAIE